MTSKSTNSQQRNQSFSMDDFAKALEKYDYEFEKGQLVRGKVIEYATDGAYIDIGGKSPAFLPRTEASLRRSADLSESLPMQEELDFLIISGQDEEGQVTVSRKQIEINQAWDNIVEIQNTGKSVQILISGINKGGVTGEIEGLRGFIPRSHLVQRDNLDSLIGQSLTANFLEIDRANNKLILSQRQVVRANVISQLEVGKLVEGRVSKIQPYGVFVDLDGITGLLHIKQVSGTHISALTNIFQIGQEIKVIIMEIDESKNRISLSTKILENYPGEVAEKLDEVMATAEERADKAKTKMTQ